MRSYQKSQYSGHVPEKYRPQVNRIRRSADVKNLEAADAICKIGIISMNQHCLRFASRISRPLPHWRQFHGPHCSLTEQPRDQQESARMFGMNSRDNTCVFFHGLACPRFPNGFKCIRVSNPV
jgi:hypothetical protein